MPAPRTRKLYSPWSNIVVQTGWTVASVRAALTAHEIADFTSSGLLIDMLGRDPRLGAVTTGVIGTRANGLLGRPFSLRSADVDDPAAVRAAEEIEEIWWEILPESELKVMLRYMWLGGGAPGELRWELRDKRWMPVVKSWQLHNLYMTETSDDEQLRNVWWLQSRQGPINFTPGDGKWLLLADGERWWLNGSVRSLSIPWLGKQFAFRDWLRHSERLGQPILKAKHPSGWDSDEVDDWYDDLKALATETTVKLPQQDADVGFDLDLLEAAGHNWESFEGLMAHVDTLYAIHVLGHNLTTEVKGGSFAAANTGNDVRIDYLRSDAQTLSTQLRTQLLMPLCEEWYPRGAELAPWPTWDVEPEKDQKAAAGVTKTAGEGLQALQKAGYQPRDIDAWSEPMGLELEPYEVAEPEVAEEPEEPEDKDEQGDTEPPEDDETVSETQLRLASGDPVGDAPGFVGGQALADELVDDSVPLARKALAPDVRELLRVVDDVLEQGGDQVLMIDRLVELYRGMSPSKLGALLEKAEMLAELKGMASVLEDL